jgi:hypothetical protein
VKASSIASALVSADESALAVFRKLVADGARVTGASPYIQLLIKGAPADHNGR